MKRMVFAVALSVAVALGGAAARAGDRVQSVDPHGPAGGAPEQQGAAPAHDHVHDHGAQMPPAVSEAEVEPRVAIEGALDLSALRALAVQDGGRRKPFDTLAREQVKMVLGTDGFKGEDPVYTFLSLMFEPDRWMPIRAVKVNNLKLLELFGTPASHRISFGDLERNPAFRARLQAIDPSDRMTGPNDNAVLELNHRGLVFANMPRMMRVVPVPGASEETPWADLERLDGRPEALKNDLLTLFRRAGSSFRAGDARGVNEDLAALVTKLRTVQGDEAPDAWRLKLEVGLNRLAPFHYAWMVFVAAASVLGISLLTSGRRLYGVGVALLLTGGTLALFGLAARTIIVERAPVANLYEASTFAIFAAVVAGTVFEIGYRNSIFGAAAATFGFFGFLLADLAPSMDRSINHVVPVLRSYWLNIHVTSMLTSYGTFAVAFVLAIFYFAKYLHARGLPKLTILLPIAISLSGLGVLFYRAWRHEMPKVPDYAIALVGAPAAAVLVTWLVLVIAGKKEKIAYQDDLFLKSVEKNFYRVCQVGFLIITTGVILGAVWANESWGRYWGWDPKETWAFITWLIYGVYIHGRMAGWFRGPSAAIWGIIGFNSVLFTLFGVSFVLPGLHSYLK